MTVPDRDLEAALRRKLSAAVSQVEPGDDGLTRIRERTAKRPPQPWLVSVLLAAVSRARYWVWRGHWVWPDSVPRPGSLTRSGYWPRHELRARSWLDTCRAWRDACRDWVASGRASSIYWLRPVAVIAGVAFIATITLTVPPLREAIENVSSSVLPGGQPSGGAGTNGHGRPAGTGGGGALTSGSHSTATTGAGGTGGSASPGTTATSQCTPAAAPSGSAQAGPGSKIAQVVSSALPVTTVKACVTPSATGQPVSVPSQTVPSGSPSQTPPGTPTPTGTSSPTGAPSGTPTQTPTATDTGSASPSPSSTPGP